MNIHNVSLTISAVRPNQYPTTGYMEFAFAGRSNVGKSSMINKLLNRKSLARVSGTPGKTITINFYNIDDTIYLVDLPGYGYAQVSKDAQNKWQKYLEEYLLKREQITSLIQLVDGRHDIQKNDFQMREWVQAYDLPIFTIVTKMDYVPRSKTLNVIKNVEKEFGGIVLPFSAIDSRYNSAVFEHIMSFKSN